MSDIGFFGIVWGYVSITGLYAEGLLQGASTNIAEHGMS